MTGIVYRDESDSMNYLMCKSKIHRAVLTDSDIDYEGSLEIDINIMNEAGILPYEKILVVNSTNGERLETYAIPGAAGSKRFCLNGAAARRGLKGDMVTIMSFGVFSPEEADGFKPTVIIMDKENNISRRKGRD